MIVLLSSFGGADVPATLTVGKTKLTIQRTPLSFALEGIMGYCRILFDLATLPVALTLCGKGTTAVTTWERKDQTLLKLQQGLEAHPPTVVTDSATLARSVVEAIDTSLPKLATPSEEAGVESPNVARLIVVIKHDPDIPPGAVRVAGDRVVELEVSTYPSLSPRTPHLTPPTHP